MKRKGWIISTFSVVEFAIAPHPQYNAALCHSGRLSAMSAAFENCSAHTKQHGDSINMTSRPEQIWKAPKMRHPKSPVITPIIFQRPNSIATVKERE